VEPERDLLRELIRSLRLTEGLHFKSYPARLDDGVMARAVPQEHCPVDPSNAQHPVEQVAQPLELAGNPCSWRVMTEPESDYELGPLSPPQLGDDVVGCHVR